MESALTTPLSKSPFGNGILWPPLDDSGTPKPLLVALLAVLSIVVMKLFYSKGAKQIGADMQEQKNQTRLAQMTAIIANQKSTFHLKKEQALELQEKDLSQPKVYEGKDNLTVKAEVRVTVDLEKAVEEVQEQSQPSPVSPSTCPPPMLHLVRQSSAQLANRNMETALKGRKLTAVVQNGKEQSVSTVDEVDALFSELKDTEFPVTFVLKSIPPEVDRLFKLLVDDIFDEIVTVQGISAECVQFLTIKDLLSKRVVDELKEASRKTLHARNLFCEEPLLPEEVRELPNFCSGARLNDIIKLAKKVLKHFPDLFDNIELKKAQHCSRKVGASQRSRMAQLLSLLAPSMPYWLSAVILQSSLECVVARLCTGQTAIMDLVSSKTIDRSEAFILVLQWLTGWYVLRIWGWFTAGLFQSKAARLFAIRVKGEAMRAILQQDFEYFDKNPAGELQERLNHDAEKLNRNLLHIPKELITELTAIIANAYIVYKMAPSDMFLTAMLPLPIIAFGQWYMLKSSNKFHSMTRRLGEETAASTAQVLSEIKTVREFVMEAEETSRYITSAMVGASIDEMCQSRAGFCGHGMHMMHITGEAVTLLLGLSKVVNGEMRAGDLIAIMMMISCMVGGKLRGIFERVSDLALVVEPAGRICDLLNSQPKIESWTQEHRITVSSSKDMATLLSALSRDGHTVRELPMTAEEDAKVFPDRRLIGLVTASGKALRNPVKNDLEQLLDDSSAYPAQLRFSQKLAPARLNGHFEFQDVHFRYPSDPRKLVLQEVTFTVEPGKQAALTGHAGCGKTTIFKLIQRLYDPTSGTILLDGHPLVDYDVHFLRSKIAIVAQENVLFATSILENVRYGVYPPPTDGQVRKALEQASALDFVEAFPDQLLTRVGSRGLSLSGGQRQRVAIARAMVRQPNILILDEATSALDPVNEKIVQAALDHLVKTTGASTLTIAHRLTTVKECDKILVFSEGRLKEQGTHEELLNIKVERLPPRGKEKEGQVVAGLYNVQWNNMMGSKPQEEASQNRAAFDEDGKIERLKSENLRLRLQLKICEQRTRNMSLAWRLQYINEEPPLKSSPDIINLESKLLEFSRHGHATYALTNLSQEDDISEIASMDTVSPITMVPQSLSLGERCITSPF